MSVHSRAAGAVTAVTAVAAVLLMAACSEGDARGPDDREIPRGDAGRRMYFELRCGEGHAGMCGELGVMWARGWGGPKDKAKADEYFRISCEGGVPTSCVEVDVELSPERQMAILEANCGKGVAFACNNLGHMLWLGEGVKKDEARARVILEEACKGGFSASCRGLVKMGGRGIGGPKDNDKALEWNAKAVEAEEKEHAVEAKYLHTLPRDQLPVGRAKPAVIDGMKKESEEARELNRHLLDGPLEKEGPEARPVDTHPTPE
jgi:TPR repeat protein